MASSPPPPVLRKPTPNPVMYHRWSAIRFHIQTTALVRIWYPPVSNLSWGLHSQQPDISVPGILWSKLSILPHCPHQACDWWVVVSCCRAYYDSDNLPEAKKTLLKAMHVAPTNHRLRFDAALTMQARRTATCLDQPSFIFPSARLFCAPAQQGLLSRVR